jgi:hypothetical protein
MAQVVKVTIAIALPLQALGEEGDGIASRVLPWTFTSVSKRLHPKTFLHCDCQ